MKEIHLMIRQLSISTLLLCFLVAPVLAADETATYVADHFFVTLKGGLWKGAFRDLHPAMQSRCGGTPNKFARKIIERFESRLTSWKISEESSHADSALLAVMVKRESGDPLLVGIAVDRDENGWSITTVSVANRDLCPVNQ